MKIFLGSSKEKEPLMTEIAAWVGSNGHTPMRWNRPEAFPAGSVTFNRLIELANLAEAAVFIFSDEDRRWYRGLEVSSPRDNVIFEYGLFLGTCGQDRVVIVQEGNPHHPTDLEGLNLIIYKKENPVDAEVRFRHWLEQAIRRSISPGSVEISDDAPLYRMLLIISYLKLQGIPPTAGHIFHLLTPDDRILEAMLVRAIQSKWVQAVPDTSLGLMIYDLTAKGEEYLMSHVQ